jgi:cellulose synthase operon protein YhjQ
MRQDQDDVGAGKPEGGEPADDVATLYSWANLHGGKYKDFSASREQARAQMRQRALTDQAKVAREEAQKGPPRESPRWDDLLPGWGRQAGAEGPVRHEIPSEQEIENQAARERSTGALPAPAEAAASPRSGLGGASRVGEEQPHARERAQGEQRIAPERRAEPPEAAPVRPAWLAETLPPSAAPIAAQVGAPIGAQNPAQHQTVVPVPPARANEAPQPARERGTPRWYALRGIFGRDQEEVQPENGDAVVPVLTFFSLAGGVGKTSLVAGVGRGLAGRGERVLLTDTNSFGILPFYFGAREVKPGVLRTFSGWTNDPPIRVLTLEAGRYEADPDLLRREMTRGARDVSRVVIDIGNGSAGMLRQAMRLSPTMVVPLIPDLASVATLPALETLFRNHDGLNGKPLQAWYVLSQFDASSELHHDVREVLREQLGERLLPFAVRRSAAVSEALAEGMTVIDYAPNSPAAEDMLGLVAWIRNIAVAAGGGHRGARWSER